MLLTAMAGGMGWGIRGQYGHETGAMIAGVLVAAKLVMLFASVYSTLHAARSHRMDNDRHLFWGCMTYGQTVGFTHDTELIGNTQALRWGLLGLFIKGGFRLALAGSRSVWHWEAKPTPRRITPWRLVPSSSSCSSAFSC